MVVVYYIVVCLYLLHCMSYCIPALYAWKLWLNENHQSLLKPKLGPLDHNDPHLIMVRRKAMTMMTLLLMMMAMLMLMLLMVMMMMMTMMMIPAMVART